MQKSPNYKSVFFSKKKIACISEDYSLFSLLGEQEDLLNRTSCCELSVITVNGCISSSNIVSYIW